MDIYIILPQRCFRLLTTVLPLRIPILHTIAKRGLCNLWAVKVSIIEHFSFILTYLGEKIYFFYSNNCPTACGEIFQSCP